MIRVENLTKCYGDFRAVDNLSLSIPKGELFCFLGPNGAGKTTTIKMLCGLLSPTEGSIRIGGVAQEEDPMAIRRISGYIPDAPYLYDRLTVGEFFEFTGRLYGVSRKETAEKRESFFSEFGLNEHEHALVRELSHGLRQRLVYASTFLQEPSVLFVDEPFVGLDPYTIRVIKTLLREKSRAGMTIFLTTHILALAEDLADRIAILNNGSLVAQGTMAELGSQTANHGRLEDLFLELTGHGEANATGKPGN